MVPIEGGIYYPPEEDIVWATVESDGIVHFPERNEAICEVVREALGGGKQTLILVRRIAHGEVLQRLFAERGYRGVPFAHGSLDANTRTRIYEDFKRGATDLLIASAIYDDSVDVPSIEVLINAGGGKSLIQTKQKLGRGLRNPGGKTLPR